MDKIDSLTCVCLRCGHKWLRRQQALPAKCPKCTSPYWNKERTRIPRAELEKENKK